MKVAPKIVFLFKDQDGFNSAIADALHPRPNSSSRRLEESFELPLDRYGVSDRKACGSLVHFVDDMGNYEVTVLLMEAHEPPILACAVNEALAHIMGETTSALPALIVPFVGSSSKLKVDSKTSTTDGSKVSVYGVQMGPETDITQLLASRTQEPPSSIQIYYEPLACFMHLVRVLNLSTSVLIGQRRQSISDKEELEVLYEIGELVANATCLCILRNKITWNPVKTQRNSKEPWRALYG